MHRACFRRAPVNIRNAHSTPQYLYKPIAFCWTNGIVTVFCHALGDADYTEITQGYFTWAGPSASEVTLNGMNGYIIWIARNW